MSAQSKIVELLQKILKTRTDKDEIQQKVEENEAEICELSKEVDALKEEFERENQNLQKKMKEAEEHKNTLKVLRQNKENSDAVLVNLMAKHKTLKKTKPSVKDEQILERGKRKHKLYKEFTGVRWDYSSPENAIEGYITNKHDFLQKISHKDGDLKVIRESLWKDIHKSTVSLNSIREENENAPASK